MKKKSAQKAPTKRKPKMISMKMLPPVELPRQLVEDVFRYRINELVERQLAASALLMREVVCEQICRQRSSWDAEHPNNALGVRTIDSTAIARATVTGILDLSSKQLRQLASDILDERLADAWPAVVTQFFVGQASQAT